MARRDGHAVVALLDDAALVEVAQLAGDGLLTAHSENVAGAAAAAERCAQVLLERDWWGDEELAGDLEAALGWPHTATSQADDDVVQECECNPPR